MSFKRFKFALFFCALCMICAPEFVFAQEDSSATESDSDWYYGKLIKSVSFKNLKHVDSKEVDGITSSFIGKRFSDELFGDLLDRIYSLDLFDDVNPEALPGDARKNTVAIVFSVVERPSVTKITYSGNRQVRTAELKEATSIKEKDVFVASKVLIDERAVRDVYLQKGFTNAKVVSSTKETAKGIEINSKSFWLQSLKRRIIHDQKKIRP